MVHLFKIPLQHSDMFVRKIDFDKQVIEYQIVDKLTGSLLEPPNKDKFTVSKKQIDFGNRFIALDLAKHIWETLNAE